MRMRVAALGSNIGSCVKADDAGDLCLQAGGRVRKQGLLSVICIYDIVF